MQDLLALQCLVDDLVDFLFIIINVYQFLFTLNTLFDKVARGPRHEKTFCWMQFTLFFS